MNLLIKKAKDLMEEFIINIKLQDYFLKAKIKSDA